MHPWNQCLHHMQGWVAGYIIVLLCVVFLHCWLVASLVFCVLLDTNLALTPHSCCSHLHMETSVFCTLPQSLSNHIPHYVPGHFFSCFFTDPTDTLPGSCWHLTPFQNNIPRPNFELWGRWSVRLPAWGGSRRDLVTALTRPSQPAARVLPARRYFAHPVCVAGGGHGVPWGAERFRQ